MSSLVALREAWADALYGADGFFLREAPANHFRTSATASPVFADAIAELALRCDVDAVWDIGAGRGELLRGLAAVNPGWRLHGVEVAPRPADLPRSIRWHAEMPSDVRGLVVANELLDDVPCSVAQVDDDGVARYVLVDPGSGVEQLGEPLDEPDADWVRRWWPDAGLQQLGVDGTRPHVALVTTDPLAYVAALARAGEAAELTASPGLGDFGWVVTGVGMTVPLA
jgi:hypothetical protein